MALAGRMTPTGTRKIGAGGDQKHRAYNSNPAVIPANAGIHTCRFRTDMRAWAFGQWIPAFAGMTRLGVVAGACKSVSHAARREDALLDHRVHAPVAIDHLGDAEVHRDRHQRDGLVFAEALGGHQEVAHLVIRVTQGQVDR
jgi:hypothetical protein